MLRVFRSLTIRYIFSRTNDQFVAEAAPCTTHKKHTRKTPIGSAGFEPAIPASELPQTLSLDRSATGLGSVTITFSKNALQM
jgi:hypothetical protein